MSTANPVDDHNTGLSCTTEVDDKAVALSRHNLGIRVRERVGHATPRRQRLDELGTAFHRNGPVEQN